MRGEWKSKCGKYAFRIVQSTHAHTIHYRLLIYFPYILDRQTTEFSGPWEFSFDFKHSPLGGSLDVAEIT